MPKSADPRSPLRLAMVGCGAITRASHLPSIVRLPDFRVDYLCDTNIRLARLARTEFDLKCEATADISDLLGKVDVAIVATPPRSHAPVAIRLLEAGIDVMCEKPLATSAAEAKAMVAAAEKYRRILSVGLVTRHHKNNTLVQELLDDNFLGTLQHVTVEFGAPLDWPMATDAYYRPTTTAGGVLFDAGIHFIDRMAWLFGDLTNISMADDSYGGFEANAILTGKLMIRGREVPCSAAFSWTHLLDNCIRLTGATATAELRMNDPDRIWLFKTIAGRRRVLSISSSNEDATQKDPYQVQLENFAASVVTRAQPHVTGSSAVLGLEIIERAYAVRQRLRQPWVETA
jgi:predicted dehydrogenase